jgi:transcriptional regulator with PAS, ATPase and Fis domain
VRGSDTAIRLSYSMKETAPKEVRQAAMVEISSALRRYGGDVSGTAERLGIGRATLNRWISEHAYLKRALDNARREGPPK